MNRLISISLIFSIISCTEDISTVSRTKQEQLDLDLTRIEGYLNENNSNTIQAVMDNKKISTETMLKNLGKADITSLVNFNLLKEYFLKNKLKVKKIVTQRFFLERMGIIERAQILEKKKTNTEQIYMRETLSRLLDEKQMGNLFKVIFGYKNKENDFFGFD